MFIKIILDRLFQPLHIAERTAADSLFGDLREEPLHLVQPRTTRRREVKMILGVTEEPAFHHRRLVSGVIVHDQVDLNAGPLGDLGVDLVEEREEFLMPMAAMTMADHLAGRHV